MRSIAPRLLLAAAFVSTPFPMSPAYAGTETVLECTFDAEPLDALIGIGGAAVGQPVTLGGAPAYVRAAPFGTPSLEIGDDTNLFSQQVRFAFLNDAEFSTGTVVISLKLYFHSLDGYVFYVRESSFSSVQFLNLTFSGGGGIGYGDNDSGGNTQIGTYTTGVSLPLTITYDLDGGTYDIDLNGTLIRDNEPFGVVPKGIGGVLIGTDFDADTNGLVSMDDLVVTATDAPSPVTPTNWGDLKAAWR